MNTSHDLNAPNITDAATILELEGLTVLDHESAPGESGVRLYSVEGHCDRVEVRPVVDGVENCPMGGRGLQRAPSTSGLRIVSAARNVLVAYGWERHGETLLGGQFLAHTPAVREARVALENAEIPLLLTGALDGRGALVHPVDGDPGSVRVFVRAGGFRYKPGPATMEWESAGAREWQALMHECLDVMDAAGWTLAHPVIHADAQFCLPTMLTSRYGTRPHWAATRRRTTSYSPWPAYSVRRATCPCQPPGGTLRARRGASPCGRSHRT